jgi:hypothetical protein
MRRSTTRRWTRAQAALIALLAVVLLSGSAILVEPGITEVLASGTTTAQVNRGNAPRTSGGATTTSSTTSGTTSTSTTTAAASSSSPGNSGNAPGRGTGNPTPGQPGNTGGSDNSPRTFTISSVPLEGLYPGANLPATVRVHNAHNQAMRITGLTGTVTGTSNPACPIGNVSVGSRTFQGTELVVAGNSTATTTLQVQMVPNPPQACQNVTFTLRFDGTGAQA